MKTWNIGNFKFMVERIAGGFGIRRNDGASVAVGFATAKEAASWFDEQIKQL